MSYPGMALISHAPNSHALEGTQREEVVLVLVLVLGEGMWPSLAAPPPRKNVGRGGVDEFWKDASLPNSWDMPSVTATRELRPVTVVTRGGHVSGIWDVSGSLL